jgi:hypothetical protein
VAVECTPLDQRLQLHHGRVYSNKPTCILEIHSGTILTMTTRWESLVSPRTVKISMTYRKGYILHVPIALGLPPSFILPRLVLAVCRVPVVSVLGWCWMVLHLIQKKQVQFIIILVCQFSFVNNFSPQHWFSWRRQGFNFVVRSTKIFRQRLAQTVAWREEHGSPRSDNYSFFHLECCSKIGIK